MKILWLAAVGLAATATGCTTILGTNIATDRVLSPGSYVEPLGQVQASVSKGRFLWAVGVDGETYEEVRKAALKQKGGDLLINAKITTTLTSYLAIYYKTEVAIEGTAAKLAVVRQEPTLPSTSPPPAKP